jgi:hypothetical protein
VNIDPFRQAQSTSDSIFFRRSSCTHLHQSVVFLKSSPILAVYGAIAFGYGYDATKMEIPSEFAYSSARSFGIE